MHSLKVFLQGHKAAIALAILTSLIIAFPQIYFRIDHKELYQEGIEAIEMLPDSPWSARAREVQDGHPKLGGIYYRDGKDDPYIFQPLGSNIVAYTGKIFGLGINDTLLLARIVYPFVTFMLIYLFVYSLSKYKRAALASASVVLLAEPILSPVGLKRFFDGSLWSGTVPVNFLELTAPVNPAMIFIFLFGFLVVFWKYYQKRTWQWGIASALLLGLNVYTYFYAATYLFAFLGVLGLCFLVQKKWNEVRSLAYVFFGGILLAIPYAWNLYQASLYPSYEEVARRLALLVSHEPQFIGIVALGGIIVFFLGFPRDDKRKYIFGLSLLLTPLVTLNQQVVTGKVLQAGHYHWYMHRPIAVIFAIITAFYLLRRWNTPQHYTKILAVLMIAVSFVVGLKVQMLAYSVDRKGGDGGQVAIERQKYAPVMAWLNAHAAKEAVVFANEEISRIVGIYTPLNVFHLQVAHATLAATDARIREQMFAFYRLRNVDIENVRETFYRERAFISAQLYGLYYREKSGRDDDIPDEIIDNIVSDYESTLSKPIGEWLYSTWSKHRVEYVVWNTEADPTWNLDRFLFLTKEATFGNITIYSFPGMKLR